MSRGNSSNWLGLIIKLMVLVILIMLGVFIYMMCSGQPLVQRIDKMAPDALKFPWETPTPTHIYYSREAIKLDNGDVELTDWYEQIDGKWVLHTGPDVLP